jgi:hypothetical protein
LLRIWELLLQYRLADDLCVSCPLPELLDVLPVLCLHYTIKALAHTAYTV